MKKLSTMVIGAVVIAGAVLISKGTDIVASTEGETAATDASGSVNSSNLAVATFAGGCFWCVESTFEKLDGVSKAISGYAGGDTENPTYHDVGGGNTGHTETVQIFYDPTTVSYRGLLHYFWREIDPTDGKGQFVDRGSMYRPAVFYHDAEQKLQIEESLEDLKATAKFGRSIAVEVLPFDKFWKAEGYHQDYYKKSPLQYKIYRRGSGRDQYLEKVWGEKLHSKYKETNLPTKSSTDAQKEAPMVYTKPTNEELKKSLTPLQYDVTQRDATEHPYSNEFWDNKQPGIYVDITSGEPLFASTAKYDSKTGWPSFWSPIDKQYIVEKLDFKIGLPRTEVRSKYGNSHLGHLFKDGPAPTGLRYCINSAALRFIPKNEITSKGYQQYAALFKK